MKHIVIIAVIGVVLYVMSQKRKTTRAENLKANGLTEKEFDDANALFTDSNGFPAHVQDKGKLDAWSDNTWRA